MKGSGIRAWGFRDLGFRVWRFRGLELGICLGNSDFDIWLCPVDAVLCL